MMRAVRRRAWWCALAGALVALHFSVAAAAAETPPRYRIGVINEAWAANHPAFEGLKHGLRELGLVEERDVTYEVRFTRGKPGAAEEAAKALVAAGVDLIFTSDHAPTIAASQATQGIPIVFTLVGDPVAVRLVHSLASPGGNVTGVSSRNTDVAPKRLEFLKRLVPGLRRVWFICYSDDVTDLATIPTLNDTARELGVQLVSRPVRNAAAVQQALKELAPGDAILAPSSNTLDIPVAVLEAALGAHVPAIFPSSLWVSHGALASYGSDFRDQGVQAARLVAKILRGTPPKDVPVEGAEAIHLALNLETVARLKLAVPRTILFRANSVYR